VVREHLSDCPWFWIVLWVSDDTAADDTFMFLGMDLF